MLALFLTTALNLSFAADGNNDLRAIYLSYSCREQFPFDNESDFREGLINLYSQGTIKKDELIKILANFKTECTESQLEAINQNNSEQSPKEKNLYKVSSVSILNSMRTCKSLRPDVNYPDKLDFYFYNLFAQVTGKEEVELKEFKHHAYSNQFEIIDWVEYKTCMHLKAGSLEPSDAKEILELSTTPVIEMFNSQTESKQLPTSSSGTQIKSKSVVSISTPTYWDRMGKVEIRESGNKRYVTTMYPGANDWLVLLEPGAYDFCYYALPEFWEKESLDWLGSNESDSTRCSDVTIKDRPVQDVSFSKNGSYSDWYVGDDYTDLSDFMIDGLISLGYW